MYSKNCTKQWRENMLYAYLRERMKDFDLFPMDWLKSTDFFTAPSSTRYHAAYEGGLFDHSVNVACMLHLWTNKGVARDWEREDSPFIIGILHDATKIGLYIEDGTNRWVHNPDYVQIGSCHGEDSLIKVSNQVDLTAEEAQCIRWHMGAYEGPESWEGYDAAIKRYPNVLFTHTADMFASKLMER